MSGHFVTTSDPDAPDRQGRSAQAAPTKPDPAHPDRRNQPTREAPAKRWDARPETDTWLASHHTEGATPRVSFRVEGWLAERGTSVWFGAGSTGKTQLLLWMAAMIASRPQHRSPTWLGGTINGTGHVLILTAEDTRPQILGRLRDIVENTMQQSSAIGHETCSRLHVMPFLSMTEDEFKHPNASLFRLGIDRVWGASEVMQEVRDYIAKWNARHDDPEDRIVGVVLDSATSMAGFDSMEGEATTSFFFYLGRLCEALGIFFTIIGHVPKAAFVPRKDPWATAAARLRGVAMWTTAPRMAVEVRHLQEWGGKGHREQPKLRDMFPGLPHTDFLVVYTAKANLLGVCREPRYLVRDSRGAFQEVERPQAAVADPEEGSGSQLRKARTKSSKARNAVPASDQADGRPKDYAPGTELVLRMIRITYPNLVGGKRVAADRVMTTLKDLHEREPQFGRELVSGASGGGATPARDGSITWHFARLCDSGVLIKRGCTHTFVRWPPISTDNAMTDIAGEEAVVPPAS
ncbi:AAA family ATPase [uncultured Sphingomonas sp.]|uniref:AAA family ATPase n=1 Tax=uncultured Sphingomonas sp. TaxID=158754 RepID=UPI0025FCB6C5|nr:AAA family ATPase [uncultured Sphingomonas sp.]